MLASSIAGMVLGAVIGVGISFEWTKKVGLRTLQFLGQVMGPAVIGGSAIGFLASRWDLLNVDLFQQAAAQGGLAGAHLAGQLDKSTSSTLPHA